MKTHIARNYLEMSSQAAELIINQVRENPNSLVCFAAGNTPLGTFSCLVEAFHGGRINFDQCRFISLDEWVGLGASDEGSCRQTLDRHFFEPCGIKKENIHFFNGTSDELEAECKAMDDLIVAHGTIDLLLLGVGINGHLGFNEPHVDLEQYSHVTDLDSVTKQVSVKYFTERKNVQKGITLGIKHLIQASMVILIADGEKKADIMRKALRHEVTNEVPVTVMQRHPNVHVCMDESAAAFVL
ncbi:glucosamine-6-phosphate deaminase [Cohnella cholangitidis]|uniref:Glucosamine-6-phosphate deaminase n=1 Tax=Cohnella cholangitidis TaxID=2598458 RepID=A0A7G5C495_9BACL|nr:glucosamine-6-phosphate deaminase [Cohnella cholangitidis]QMV44029.1 glucosamine-6-phosphate deaminase [Cohnella cholangitidis]